jgi:tRNA threonylcarbamoyladenosine biosynthesis protein TsaB
VAVRLHEATDYSSWLLPAVEELLTAASTPMEAVDLLAVATGPGSFTGVRVGLTTVKAWAEVYGMKIVGVSRLEAMARLGERTGLVAACYDAQRGQIFGGLYRRTAAVMEPVEREMVIAPEAFVAFVDERAGRERVEWTCLDPELIRAAAGWQGRLQRGDHVVVGLGDIASLVGELAEQRARRGEFTGALELDANYVRRSDAEILWKGSSSDVR